MEYRNLKKKAAKYLALLAKTSQYRTEWKESLREMIRGQLQRVIDETGLPGEVEVKDELQNLEAIVLTLGQVESGISETIGKAQRHLIKSNGMLIYQQLFNGKVMVSIVLPFIESLGKPQPPKSVEILRPEELKPPFILRHAEEFLKEIIAWEDYDDNVPQAIGFQTGVGRAGMLQPNKK